MSIGFWDTKYTPTPLERISRTTSSTFSSRAAGASCEQQVGLIEEEHQLRLLRIPHLRQPLEQLGQQPQQEAGVEPRALHQPVRRQDVHHAPAIHRLEQVVDVEHGLTEEAVASLLLDLQQRPLNRPDAGGRHIAVLQLDLGGVLPHELEDRPQILEVEQQQAVVVGHAEGQRQDPFLGVVEIQQAPEHQGAHVGDGGPHRVALLAEHVPEGHRTGGEAGRRQPQLRQPRLQFLAHRPGGGQAAQIPLHIGQEDRNADAREALRQQLQADRLAGAGGAGDAAVTVGEGGQQGRGRRGRTRQLDGLSHGGPIDVRIGSCHASMGAHTGNGAMASERSRNLR